MGYQIHCLLLRDAVRAGHHCSVAVVPQAGGGMVEAGRTSSGVVLRSDVLVLVALWAVNQS